LKLKDHGRLASALVLVVLSIAALSTSVSSTRFGRAETSEPIDPSRYSQRTCDPGSSIDHVLIVASDGMRADTLEGLNHPTVKELIQSGFYTRGYTQPDRNGARIEQGTDQNVPAIVAGKPLHDIYGTGTGLMEEGYTDPGKPMPTSIETLFEVAHRNDFYTGFVYSKSKVRTMANPDHRRVRYVRGSNNRSDSQVRNSAVEFIKSNAARKWYLFAWFSEPDYVQVGASDAYRNSVQRNLNFLADIIATMKATCTYANSIIALTADHGMSDGNGHHGTQYWHDPRVYEVPWLLAAPGLNLLHRRNGPHYNHEVVAAASHLALGALPAKSDSKIWLEVQRPATQAVSVVR
jgi:Type I phosphodiesterase / nucleotide pyrophosphatase